MKNPFNLSNFHLKNHEITAIDGFFVDLQQALVNIGLRGYLSNELEKDFVQNMGMMCVLQSIAATRNKVDDDWNFTQHGIIYTVNKSDCISVYVKSGEIIQFNNIEYSFLIGIKSSQEIMASSLRNGFKNPFRMCNFYKNYLTLCLKKIPTNIVDSSKVLDFLARNKGLEYSMLEPIINDLLAMPVGE